MVSKFKQTMGDGGTVESGAWMKEVGLWRHVFGDYFLP
jgi:hypothetical protein